MTLQLEFAMKHGRFLFALFCGALSFGPSALAQLPTSQLTSIFPPGGKQSSTIDVAIAGSDLDDCSQLLFNHGSIKSTPKTTDATVIEPARPLPNQFTIAIGSNVPPGIYEVR